MNDKKQVAAAYEFARRWDGKGYEKGQSQTFWMELLTEVFGVSAPSEVITFEDQVHIDHTSFIDAYIEPTHVMIEQKSIDKDLRKAIRQSDGSLLTPFQQAKRYSAELPYDRRPRWIVTSNFREFLIYDMNNPQGEPQSVLLKDLGREYYRLQFLVDTGSEHLRREMEVSMKAGEIVGEIYDLFLRQYIDPDSPHALRSLNILCVRLVFCLYAEDAGVFGRHGMFHDYLEHYPTEDMRAALIRLFRVLDTPPERRDPYLKADLAAFPYTNGGLFEDEEIEIPQFTDEIRDLLLNRASADFDWSAISPTIFGAVFESTLNPETRRSGGMHYTSIENIHKVIDPLFLNALHAELGEILSCQTLRTRHRRLREFQERLARLTFLDPACGSGNFLTETYLSLRRMENEVIRELSGGQTMMGEFLNPIRVSISQFFGIEINDFAVTVATTALWISEAQMLAETERIVKQDIDFLPLKAYANIREGNSLHVDWASVVPPAQLSFIIGNPPFVGARLMSREQKADMALVFGSRWKNLGNMDYVCAWYKKAADMMRGARIRAALVSTNSVSQGEQVANLWQPLMAGGIRINFVHTTFRWDSEASLKAHVHCVIIGFSRDDVRPCMLYDSGQMRPVTHINAYLTEGADVFIGSRSKPVIPGVPEIGIGNQPIDGGNYLFEREEMEAFIQAEPQSAPFFRPWYGAVEFIHRHPRYCLWLGDCTPAQLRAMPHCMKRIENVHNLRLASNRTSTRKLADMPTRFQVENMPEGNYIIIPSTSSERRRYVPMGFMEPIALASNAVHIIPNATLYHFGVLESNVHMAWMRVVCGRLKSDYRYSKDVVYNNFPWPEPTAEQRLEIERTARGILDARALYPDSSLADLYDELTMPPELRRAHQENDRAVMRSYGFPVRISESECVSLLFARYASLS